TSRVAGARQRRTVRPHGEHGASAVRAPPGPPAARAPRPRPAGPVPPHLDPRPGADGAVDVRVDARNVTPAEAREVQLRLRERIIMRTPRGFSPRLVGGADLSIQRFSRRGY